MVDNFKEIKKYISERKSDNSYWNIRGVIRMKDRYVMYMGIPDQDIFNIFIESEDELQYDMFESYFEIYPDLRIYFDPNPIKKTSVSEKLIEGKIKLFNQFHDYISIIPKLLIDIDTTKSDNIENIRNITKEYTQILLDIPTLKGQHIITEYIRRQNEFYSFKNKLSPYIKDITFKTNYNLTLLYTKL